VFVKLLLYFSFNFCTKRREGNVGGACSNEPETLGKKLINLLSIIVLDKDKDGMKQTPPRI